MGKLIPLFPDLPTEPRPAAPRPVAPIIELTAAARQRRQELWERGRARAQELLKGAELQIPDGLTAEDVFYYYLGLGQTIVNAGDDRRLAARRQSQTRW